jgi:hypothetical protein
VNNSLIFQFEADFGGTLHCIPMRVRLNLDLCGIKLSLKQWNRLTQETRRELLRNCCEEPDDVSNYRLYLSARIGAETRTAVEFVAVEPLPAWKDPTHVPERLIQYAALLGVAPPSSLQWMNLSDLQRFALFKLTRPSHDNDNFIPAMREFGFIG